MQIKLTHPNAKPPHRAHPTDAGADLFATEPVTIHPYSYETIDFGVAIELPPNTVGLVFAKSGLGARGIRPRNCVGVIDETYRGSIKGVIDNESNDFVNIEVGHKVAQIEIVPVIYETFEVVDELTDTARGHGGFGSTGL